MPTRGRLSRRSTTFPTYMLAISPQKIAGCSLMNSGPGVIPWTMSAASRTAGIGPVGTPRASMGTRAPSLAALLADSGPATPSMAPLPNRSGCLESRRSTA